MIESLLQTKLYLPPLRPGNVSRPRLIQQLNQGLDQLCKLTLVSAPAGFGKTTLVSEWVGSLRLDVAEEDQIINRVAWLSLDEGDNDLTRFLTYFVTALSQIKWTKTIMGETALGMLRSTQPPPIEAIMTSLINDVSAIPDRTIIVLDDYHLIAAPSIHDALTFLLDHQPPQMHLVLSTRVAPPWLLARLRARREMNELRPADLRFTPDEAAVFLNSVMGLDISLADVAVLEDRTEGWIAGLQMAALSMQGGEDSSGFIEAFSGSHHFILDYLVEEILEQQTSDVQEFLLKTAVLEQMTAPLCDAVTDGNDSQTILTRLEQANLFLIPLDDERCWYRYHHLFADLLKSILRQRKSVEEIRTLHRRASRWYQDSGSLEVAMIHAMAAQDFERAASMIEENIASMLARSEVPVLLSWIKQLPEHLVRSRPWIDVYHANTLALTGQLNEVDSLLKDVELRIGPDTPQRSEILGHIAAVRAYAANLRGNSAQVTKMAALTAKYLPEGHLDARGMAAYALADTRFAEDDIQGADQALLDMLRIGEKTGHLILIVTALCELATIKKVQGKLHQAEELYGQAWQRMIERNGLDSRVRCAYEFGLADLLCEWNQLDAAYEHVMTGMEFRQRLGGYFVVGDLPLMRILQARGDTVGALDALHVVEQVVQTYYFQLASKIAFRAARVVQWLSVGDVATASRWAKECGDSELEQMALVRVWLAKGHATNAQRLLDRQKPLAEAEGRIGRLIEILGLQALALEAQDQHEEADTALSQALLLARPEGYMRLFLDMGRPLYNLLARSVKQGAMAQKTHIVGDYVRTILNAFQQEQEAQKRLEAQAVSLPLSHTEALIDPLTEREMETLQLLAEGLSNKEIASKLIVAPSTVKQHLKNIYVKLDVHSRTQAIARGQELNLL